MRKIIGIQYDNTTLDDGGFWSGDQYFGFTDRAGERSSGFHEAGGKIGTGSGQYQYGGRGGPAGASKSEKRRIGGVLSFFWTARRTSRSA